MVKYGFTDTDYFNAAQVAAQVVSGIGFIGAGMILHRQNAVHGLTSAAGIWLTAAIAMAAAAGMYYIAIGAAVLIILIQFFLQLHFGLIKEKNYTDQKNRISCSAP
ncbi:MAG: MgtC/SapB family protein, partial [Clostridia bacterium]|nr:MgtC/SapB family protein [Clostridia bacterium]